MNRGSRIHLALVASLLSIVVVPSAYAQSAIAGVVRDSSGAVLPGVSVEASSAALIEGIRSAVTDNAGGYKIENLRPGVYAVTFTLTGFRSVKRDEISLPTSFTATINAEMSVGALQESVTVSGESPLVDVRGSVSQSVMSRERARHDSDRQGSIRGRPTDRRRHHLDARRRRHAGHAAADAAGARLVEQRQRVHGRRRPDSAHRLRRQPDRLLLQRRADGRNQLPDQLAAGGGAGRRRANQHDPARRRQHRIRGAVFVTGANEGMQSRQPRRRISSTLGFKVQNRVQSVYDVNFTFGGPVKRDRLWFFATFRRWSANNFLGNTFTSTGAQAVDDQHISDCTVRLTLQANREQQVLVPLRPQRQVARPPPNNWITASINDPISDVVQTTQLNYIGEIKWISHDRQPAARRSGDVHDAGQLHPVVPAGRRAGRDRDLRSDPVGRSAACRRARTPTPRGCSPTPATCRTSPARTASRSAPRCAPAGRRSCSTIARRHRADREQRRAELGAPGEQRRAVTRSQASTPASTSRTRGASAA